MKGYEIFEELLRKKGVKIADVVKATGMTPATIYDWKAGRYRPKDDKRKMIADYFGVTLEYLDTGKDDAGNELPAYYLDQEAAEIAQELYDRPELKVLFRTTQRVSPEDLKVVQAMVDKLAKRDDD